MSPDSFQLQLRRQLRSPRNARLRPPGDARWRDDQWVLLRAPARRPQAEGRVHRRREERLRGLGAQEGEVDREVAVTMDQNTR